MLYPLKFSKVFKEKIWGGNKLESILKIDIPQNMKIGESWEVSCHENGFSLIENGEFKGESLRRLSNVFGEDLLGKEIYEKYGNKFPLLIKYLDINDKLSIQVHPNDKYALEFENEFGKSEAWYIIDASEDAKLIMGLVPNVNKEKLMESLENRDFKDIFNVISVKKGDFIHITPGLIHATLEGSVLICEIQQNSDITYRLYDFDRVIDGEKRTLHLNKALDVIDYAKRPVTISKLSETSKNVRKNILKDEHFNVDSLIVDGEFESKAYKNFQIFSVLNGFGNMQYNNERYELQIGDTYFIPAKFAINFIGKLEFLISYI